MQSYQKEAAPSSQDRACDAYFSSFLFAGLPEGERQAAYSAPMPRLVTYREGEKVVTAGEPFSAFGLLVEGELAVTREGEKRRVLHRRLTKGDAFGVSSLFVEQAAFPTTVTALCDSLVLLVGEETLLPLFAACPTVARNYIALLTEKIRFLNKRLDALAGRSAEERVAAYLLSHREERTLGITKSALASLLGLGRASLYRILELFEKEGLVITHRDAVVLCDAAALEQFIKKRKET